MKKIYVLCVLIFLTVGCLGCLSFMPAVKTITVKAYTEKQKKQVKAWLSAHGYPPTMEGAYQAYQDYLSGKLTLSEEEQELMDKNTGKSSKKKKANSKKKSNSKSKIKKKKASGGKDKAAATPASTPTPEPRDQTSEETGAGGKEVGSAKKCATEDTPQGDSGNFGKGIFFYIGGGIILLFVVVLVCVRRKKSSC